MFKWIFSAVMVVMSLPAFGVTLTLESGINGNIYNVEGTPGTAGTLGTDYQLGTYFGGGNGGLGHGFGNSYSFAGGFVAPLPPSGFNATGAMEAADHNWAQGTTRAIVVDMGANADDRAIVFNSLDHLGVNTVYGDPEKDLWNAMIEGIEFTVYGTNTVGDATAAAATAGYFGAVESGTAQASWEQAMLEFVFLDGWKDHGAAQEGDDFASVWTFGQSYQYIAVYSNNTDPFVGDGFRSFDNELDAIGTFIGVPTDVPEPGTLGLLGACLLGLRFIRRRRAA